MPHDHQHPGPTAKRADPSRGNERKILVSFLLIFSFMLVEAVGGILSGSLALLADAGHMLTDAVALLLALLAFRLGRKARDGRRSFGYARSEVIAGMINALTLFAIAGWIVYEAIQRFRDPAPIMAGWMFAVAVTGMLVNLFVLWFLTRGDSDHVNVRGAVLHVMGDLLGSVGAIVAAIIIWLTGWIPIDPILSVLVSLLILRSAFSLLKRTLHILLEGAPQGAEADRIQQHLITTVPGLAKVSHVHSWQITSGRALATVHIQPEPGADLRDLTQAVEHELHAHFGIEHATVAIDWQGDSACSLDCPAAADLHAGHAH